METTTTIRVIGKVALYGFAAIGIAVVSLAVLAAIRQEAKDQQFVHDFLLPIAAHVQAVKRTTGRLPTDEEFTAWSETTFTNKMIVYYQNRPDFCRTWGKEGDAFLVGAWRGEWVHYYCSWSGKDFAGD